MQYPRPNESDGHWGIPDEPYLHYFADQLNETPQPFCKVVFTLSSHHPYFVPEHYKSVLPRGTMPIHQAVAYSDLSLKKFFEMVKSSKWYNNTIFLITAAIPSACPFRLISSADWHFSGSSRLKTKNLRTHCQASVFLLALA